MRYAVMALVLTCLFKKFRKGVAACKAECPTTGAVAGPCVSRSQLAVFMVCQIPFKLGLPSGMRGILGAGVCAIAETMTASNPRSHA